MYTVNKYKQLCHACSSSVFGGDTELDVEFATVKRYPAPDATPVNAPTPTAEDNNSDDELAVARRHIVLLQQRIRSTVAAGKVLHNGIAKLTALRTKLSTAVGNLSRLDLRVEDPSDSIRAINSASTTVHTVLTKARTGVGKVSLLPEELAEELYCIALLEDKDLVKQLTDLDLNGTTLTLANLQVCLQNMEANAEGRTAPAVQALYGSARAAALLATSTPQGLVKPSDSRSWPRG